MNTRGKAVLSVGGTILLIGAIATVTLIATNSSAVNSEDEIPQEQLSSSSINESQGPSLVNINNIEIDDRVKGILDRMPIIDGHNDFPWNLRNMIYNDLSQVDFSANLSEIEPWKSSPSSHTDIPRLRAGRVGGQFWVAYTDCKTQYKDSVEQTFEQVDVIKRLVNQYPNDLQFATSTNDIENAISNGKIASLIGVEGGHSIQSSFGILRTLYSMGVRYMTMTHGCNTPWADASPVDAPNATIFANNPKDGMSDFGLKIVEEMNRLGMMIDLSHVSAATMRSALTHSRAPVIFSHSSARGVCNHHRNVPDDVLQLVKETNSLVMITFVPGFVQCDKSKNATMAEVIQHINYVKNLIGADYIGLGGDYDGVTSVTQGLEDVSKFPYLIQALLNNGWTEEELEKLAGRNLLRVLRDVEKIRDELSTTLSPHQETLTRQELVDNGANLSCITASFPGDAKIRKKRLINEQTHLISEE